MVEAYQSEIALIQYKELKLKFPRQSGAIFSECLLNRLPAQTTIEHQYQPSKRTEYEHIRRYPEAAPRTAREDLAG